MPVRQISVQEQERTSSSAVNLDGSIIQGDASSKRRSSGEIPPLKDSLKFPIQDSSSSPFIPDGLTSSVYGTDNPPEDWCDVGLLIPHEALRREMAAMVDSVSALKKDYDDSVDDWRILYFAEWYVDIFSEVVHSHHENEETIYFPWIQTKASMPEKKMAKDHGELIEMINNIKAVCDSIITKEGKGCSNEIEKLQQQAPIFEKHMLEHLKEEEEMVPPLLRENFTQEEEDKCLQKILKREGLSGLRNFVPPVHFAMQQWAKPEFVEEFLASMPGPIRSLVEGYYIPDYKTSICPKRDAPKLKSKPTLSKVGCCKISFCFPCAL